jgi:hypothetical protein
VGASGNLNTRYVIVIIGTGLVVVDDPNLDGPLHATTPHHLAVLNRDHHVVSPG